MELTTTTIIDCTGRISHRLTLQLDGTVTVAFADGREARLDPHARVNFTPCVPVGDALMDAARSLRPG
jgi:hypothetical protein